MKKSNYSEYETELVTTEYLKNPTKRTVLDLAEQLERSPKSIIGKLSRDGHYRREGYVGKTGEKPITKVELRELVEDATGIQLEGLEKAPKNVLRTLCEYFEIDVPV